MRVAAARHGRSRPAPPSPSSTKPHLRERAQVVAARGGAVADDGRALGRGRLVDRVQVVEQGEARRVGERAHRARIGEGECCIERDLSKLLFREPGVKHAVAPSRGRARPGRRPAPRRCAPRRACRARSRRGAAASSPAANAGAGSTASIPAYSGSCSQSGSSIHSPTSCSARKSASTQTNSASPPATRRQVSKSSSRVVGRSTALKVPAMPLSAARTIHAARSRTSITCAAASGGAGASTWPPSAMRCGQYVKRPVGSHGPDDQARTRDERLREALRGPLLRRAPSARRRPRATPRSARRARRPGTPRSGASRGSRRRRSTTRTCSGRRRRGRRSSRGRCAARSRSCRPRRRSCVRGARRGRRHGRRAASRHSRRARAASGRG